MAVEGHHRMDENERGEEEDNFFSVIPIDCAMIIVERATRITKAAVVKAGE